MRNSSRRGVNPGQPDRDDHPAEPVFHLKRQPAYRLRPRETPPEWYSTERRPRYAQDAEGRRVTDPRAVRMFPPPDREMRQEWPFPAQPTPESGVYDVVADDAFDDDPPEEAYRTRGN